MSASPAYHLSQVFEDTDANVLKFSEQELHEILGIMESRGHGEISGAQALPRPESHADLLNMTLPLDSGMHLQFQPHSPGPSEQDPASASSTDNYPALETGFRAAPSSTEQIAQVSQILGEPGHGTWNANAPSPAGGWMPPAAATMQPPSFPGFAFPVPGAAQQQPSYAQQQQSQEQRSEPQSKQVVVSHSSVEKQRRDRINSLIDELRDLVPPQKGTQCPPGAKLDGSAEARRPKHVVLADTISLLRQFKLNPSSSGSLGFSSPPLAGSSSMPAPSLVKDEPDSMRVDDVKNSESSELPLMPNLPVSLSSFAGVTVEKGTDLGVMYVQVKCRDRRGLLSDIINALKMLPLEIRTAAVVTCGDGMVRDVFEIRVDDPDLKAEEIQNVVHDGLYHQFMRGDDGTGKKHRASDH